MQAPDNLQYTRDHEWVLLDPDSRVATVGVTDFAQDALGDVVFVQCSEVGTNIQAGMTIGEVESSKSVSDIYAPVTGTVVEVNPELGESPQRLNQDPYGTGWICKVELSSDASTDHLLNSADYRGLVEA
jgi:glycine cleavage system H protein